jgi:GNAT superfamily N-acetyltransferase
MAHHFIITDGSDSHDAEQLMENLDSDAAAKGLPQNRSLVTLCARHKDNTLIGGVHGYILWGWLCIHYLWVRQDMRSQGLGSQLLAAVEYEAAQRGCHSVFLNTMSFQAAPFYLDRGYRQFGTLENFCGHERVFLQKNLEGSTHPDAPQPR